MKKALIIVGIVIVIIVAAVAWKAAPGKPGPEANAPPAATAEETRKAVRVVAAGKQDLAQSITLHGKLAAKYQATVVPEVPGKVAEVKVEVGDNVKAGEVLIQLEPEDLALQVRQAQAALDAAKANLQRFLDGARPEEIEQAEAALEQATANYENVKLTYERSHKLYSSGVLPRKDWDAIQAQLTVAEAQKTSAEKTLALVKQGARETDIAAAKASVQQAEVSLQAAKLRLADATITTPIAGTVSRIDAKVGNMAAAGVPVAIVVDTRQLELNLQVGEREIVQITPGQPVSIRLSALPGKEFAGVVRTIAPAADPQTGLFPVTIEVDNKTGAMRPGMYASATITVAMRSQAVAVPETAILAVTGQPRVFVVEGDTAEERPVTTGISGNGYTEILSGLAVGEEVVVSGQEFLRSGDKVQIVERGEVR